MSTNPPPDQVQKDRKKLVGVGVFLAFLVAVLMLVLYALGLWGSGEMAWPLG